MLAHRDDSSSSSQDAQVSRGDALRSQNSNAAVGINDDDACGLADISDAEFLFLSIVSRIPRSQKGENKALRGAFVSQIQAQSHNPVDMVTSLQKMRLSSRFRFLSCAYAGVDADFIMDFDEYLDQLIHFAENIDTLAGIVDTFKALLAAFPNLSIFHDDLMRFLVTKNSSPSSSSSSKDTDETVYPRSERDVQFLVTAGYLRKRRDTSAADVYWFSHPGLGPMLARVAEARKGLLSVLRLRQFKEIYTSELVARAGQSTMLSNDPVTTVDSDGGFLASRKRKLVESGDINKPQQRPSSKTSCLKSLQCTLVQGIHFHILEMIGSGLITKTDAPRGQLLRLAR